MPSIVFLPPLARPRRRVSERSQLSLIGGTDSEVNSEPIWLAKPASSLRASALSRRRSESRSSKKVSAFAMSVLDLSNFESGDRCNIGITHLAIRGIWSYRGSETLARVTGRCCCVVWG